jgi:hypothetical protein
MALKEFTNLNNYDLRVRRFDVNLNPKDRWAELFRCISTAQLLEYAPPVCAFRFTNNSFGGLH